jgi:sulfotransferase
MEKTLHFISGLPRSGTTLISNLLNQNANIHSRVVSPLATLLATNHGMWENIEQNLEYPDYELKKRYLRSILDNFYNHIDAPFVFDKDRGWIPQITLLESVLDRPVKIVVCVRNPAEIVASFEKLRKENPLFFTRVDDNLRETSSIASRAYWYAAPEGMLGAAHKNLLDALTMGYRDRLLFIDYNRFCNTPRSQMQRIYDFFELPHFDHDFKNIVQHEKLDDRAVGLPNLHKLKPSLDRTVTNCVEYLGMDLYQQYNSQVFWDAFI